MCKAARRSADAAGSAKAAKKQKYAAHKYKNYKPHESDLNAGMRGALVTCDVHVEKHAIRECFQLFEQLVEEADAPSAAEPANGGGSGGGDGGDAAGSGSGTAGDALALELRALQETHAKGASSSAAAEQPKKPQFSVAQTGVSGCVVIRFNDPSLEPLDLVDRVMEDVTRRCAPHAHRMLPVQATCAAKTKAILEAAAPLLAPLRGYEGTFAVNWRRRCNTDVDKMEVIDGLATLIQGVAPKARVDLKAAEAVINVDVVKTTCCLAVLPRWRHFGEYTLQNVKTCAQG